MSKYEDKVTITEAQLKKCVEYSNKKSKDAREKFSELIGKKGEFVVYNFLKKRLKVDRIQGTDLEVFTKRETPTHELPKREVSLSNEEIEKKIEEILQ